jgi:dTDP-4-amino-4,6-dideoxygalactose transaminase
MRDEFLPFSPPQIGQDEIDEVVDTLRSDWITTGPKVREFESQFADFLGVDSALATSSATDAMQVSLAALGIQSGDEIITTPMTFCSSVHVIEHLGAKPVLVDVDPETLTISPEQIERAINQNTRAILPVHLYGHPCDMEAVQQIADQHELAIVEDAAHALPASYQGNTIGTGDNLTAFSFYATKNMTTSEGGMLVGPPNLIKEARVWSLHGMNRDAWKRYSETGSWYYEVVKPGYKCNMTDIQASLGLHQLRQLPSFQKRRLEIVTRYHNAFRGLAEIEIPSEKDGVKSAWHLYVIRLNLNKLTIGRSEFIDELRVRNIGTSVHFIPIHLHPYYRDRYGYNPDDFPVAYREYQRIISLPLNLKMTDRDVGDVIDAVLDTVECNNHG